MLKSSRKMATAAFSQSATASQASLPAASSSTSASFPRPQQQQQQPLEPSTTAVRGHRALSLQTSLAALRLPDAVKPALKKRWSWKLKKPRVETDLDRMKAWRPPASPVDSHHSSVHSGTQGGDPLSPPPSRAASPVLILPFSSALPASTYASPASPVSPHTADHYGAGPSHAQHPQHHHHHHHRDHARARPRPEQVALPPTPPHSPVVDLGQPSFAAPAPAPRPSFARMDTPVPLSPRSPDVSAAVLRVGAWVGVAGVPHPPEEQHATL